MKTVFFSLIVVTFSGYLVVSEVNYFNNELGGKSAPSSEDAIRVARIQNSEDEKKRRAAKGLPLVDKSPPAAKLLKIY